MRKAKAIQFLYLVAGHLSIIAAIIGLALPLVPSIPFVLLATFCYERGSPKLHQKMLDNRYIGPHLRKWEKRGAISLRVKAITLILITISASSLIYRLPLLWADLAVVAVALSAALYILTRPAR